VPAEFGNADVHGAGIAIIALAIVGAGLTRGAVLTHRAVLVLGTGRVVRSRQTTTFCAAVLGAAYAVVAVGIAATFGADSVTTGLRFSATRFTLTGAVGCAAVDGAGIAVVAIFEAVAPVGAAASAGTRRAGVARGAP
jgi:hypothetical protein